MYLIIIKTETTLVAVDTETSGLSAASDRVIEVALLQLKSHIDNEKTHARTFQSKLWQSLLIVYITVTIYSQVCITVGRIHPEGDFSITPSAFATHGIAAADLEGCLGTKDVLTMMLTKLSQAKKNRSNLAIVGHNIANFDLTLLLNEMDRCELSRDMPTGVVTHTIDTLELARNNEVWEAIKKDPPSSLSLASLYDCFFDVEQPGAHSSLGDVKANLAVLLKLDPTLKFASENMKPINDSIN